MLYGIFPTPIIHLKFNDHKKYNFSPIPKKIKRPSGWAKDLYSTYPNTIDDEFIDNECIESLKNDIKNCINDYFLDIKIPTNWYYSNFWYNVYYNNFGQELHNHLSDVGFPSNYWSGIYYYTGTTPTVFQRSDFMYQTQIFNGCLDSKINFCFWDKWFPDVVDGDIILFPPHLNHFIEMKSKDENQMRMTFSFNICLYT